MSEYWRLPVSSTISQAFTPASLRDNRSHTIGLVVPEITNHGFAVFSHELEMLCREAGAQLLISCTDENPGQESVVVNNMISRGLTV